MGYSRLNSLIVQLNVPIVMSIALAACVCVVSVKTIVANLVKKQVEREFELVVGTLGYAIEHSDMAHLLDGVTIISSRDYIKRLSVIKEVDSIVLADSLSKNLGKKVELAWNKPSRYLLQEYRQSSSKDFYSISDGNSIYLLKKINRVNPSINQLETYLVLSNYDEQGLKLEVAEEHRLIYYSCAACMVFMMAVIYLSQRKLLFKPLSSAKESLEEQSATGEAFYLHIYSNNELGQLALKFNYLSKHRQMEFHVLRKSYEDLLSKQDDSS